MRISDWSSDVCSSDLPERSEGSARVAAEIPRCARDGSAHRMNRLIDDRTTRLFIALAAFFCVNAVLAEFIGVKIFALEDTLGIQPLEWNLFGQSGSLSFTAGTLLWPRSEEHTSELQSLMRTS